MMTYKKSAPQIHDSYELQSMNLNTIYRHSEQFEETRCFQKKENSSNIKEVKYYNYSIREHFV